MGHRALTGKTKGNTTILSAAMADGANLCVDTNETGRNSSSSVDFHFSSDMDDDTSSDAHFQRAPDDPEYRNNNGLTDSLDMTSFARLQQEEQQTFSTVGNPKMFVASDTVNENFEESSFDYRTSGAVASATEKHNQTASSDTHVQLSLEKASLQKRSIESPKQQQFVIDLLDSSDDEEEGRASSSVVIPTVTFSKKPRLILNAGAASATAVASYQARSSNMPNWMKQSSSSSMTEPGSSDSVHEIPTQQRQLQQQQQQRHAQIVPDHPEYLQFPPGFQPTWIHMTPPSRKLPPPTSQPSSHTPYPQKKLYRLSLLNVHEFTIEGLSPQWNMPPSSISGLRVPIRQISRKHGKSVYEFDRDENGVRSGGGKWRIPLGAYHEFAAYLRSDPHTRIIGIPPNQLQIASLERARKEKGYPNPEQLIEYGVPVGLAKALAPFQRGGVEFVKEKGGRALIADGKHFWIHSF